MTTPDLIPRRAVLDAIDDMRKFYMPFVIHAFERRIAAIPAVQVDSTPAPQPALDVADNATIRAERNAYQRRAKEAEKALLGQDDWRERTSEFKAALISTTKQRDLFWTQRDTLAALLAEAERAQEATSLCLQNNARVSDELRKELDAALTRADAAEKRAIAWEGKVNEVKVELFTEMQRSIAAEQALADAQAALGRLGEVEWEVQSEHDPYPFEPLKEKDRAEAEQDGRTIRAIRRVLGAGGASKEDECHN